MIITVIIIRDIIGINMERSTNINLEELTDGHLKQLMEIMVESGIPLSKTYAKWYCDSDNMRRQLAKRLGNPYEVRVNSYDQNKILFFNRDDCLSVEYISAEGFEENDEQYLIAFDRTFGTKKD